MPEGMELKVALCQHVPAICWPCSPCMPNGNTTRRQEGALAMFSCDGRVSLQGLEPSRV